MSDNEATFLFIAALMAVAVAVLIWLAKERLKDRYFQFEQSDATGFVTQTWELGKRYRNTIGMLLMLIMLSVLLFAGVELRGVAMIMVLSAYWLMNWLPKAILKIIRDLVAPTIHLDFK